MDAHGGQLQEPPVVRPGCARHTEQGSVSGCVPCAEDARARKAKLRAALTFAGLVALGSYARPRPGDVVTLGRNE